MNTQTQLTVYITPANENLTEEKIIANDFISQEYEELIKVKSQIAKLDLKKDKLEDSIKNYMKNTSELVNNWGKTLATWKTSTAKTLDQKSLKESNIDLSNFYVEKQKRTFLIK
jgi:predicted phage-related endonuclease